MNINCTSNCVYQADGKCTMDRVPEMLSAVSSVSAAPNDEDCPYFNLI